MRAKEFKIYMKLIQDLDVVYNLIMKNSEAAIIEANSTVESMNTSQTNSYETNNNNFKTEFMNFLGTTPITSNKNR